MPGALDGDSITVLTERRASDVQIEGKPRPRTVFDHVDRRDGRGDGDSGVTEGGVDFYSDRFLAVFEVSLSVAGQAAEPGT